MEISNITRQANQINTSSPSSIVNTSNVSGQSSTDPVSSQSSITTPQGQMVSISSHINYIQQQLDALLDRYPPFFPAGAPQRIDLIKGFKWVQDKIENSIIPADFKKGLSDAKLSDNASDNDISNALNNLIQIKNTINQNSTEDSNTQQPGVVVNTKI